jgi:hypothetical protein
LDALVMNGTLSVHDGCARRSVLQRTQQRIWQI